MSENSRALALTDDALSALILVYIHTRYKWALREGRAYAAIPRATLMKETRCTLKQLNPRLTKMRRSGLFTSKQHLIKFKDGVRNVSCYQQNDTVFKALEYEPKVPLSGPQNGLAMGPQKEPAMGPQKGTLLLEEKDLTYGPYSGPISELHSQESDFQSKEYSSGSLKANPPTPLPATGPGEPSMKKGMKVQSVHEVEQAVKAHKLLHKPGSLNSLGDLWITAVHEQTKTFVPPLIKKQFQQLKMFAVKCHPHKPEAVLSYAVKNWVKFTIKVEQDEGIEITPDVPNIGFILQHVGVAVNVAFPIQPPKQEAPVAKFVPQPLQSIAAPVEEYPQTLAELWGHPEPDGE